MLFAFNKKNDISIDLDYFNLLLILLLFKCYNERDAGGSIITLGVSQINEFILC